ncbi:CBN-DSH-2 protein [Aphelenchoides besseyi]|nr:CBN-DSH-2 protein [Aphelenchoides besseyi]KAI6194571.1 CBN-DSH-2 protein [Aphelenchoides besseyi]
MNLSDSFEDTDVSDAPPHLLPEISGIVENTEPQYTIVVYHLDDETIPYSTTIPVPPSRFTLAHLKRALNRRNFKCYAPHFDEALQQEVKVDILDDHAILEPNRNDRFLLHLVTVPTEESLNRELRSGTLKKTGRHQHIPLMRSKGAIAPINRKVSGGIYANHADLYRQSRRSRRLPIYEDSRTSLDDISLLDKRRYCPRNFSDSEASTDFTTVSEMEERRNARRHIRRARSFSMLSSTCDDTDISMGLKLYTASIKVEPGRDPGLKVLLHRAHNRHEIYVDEIIPGSPLALDGRLQKGHLIIAVDNIQLGDYSGERAVEILKTAFQKAAKNRGHVQLTYCTDARMPTTQRFELPDESVRPLDTECWRDNVNQLRQLEQLDMRTTALIGKHRPCSSSGVGSLQSSLIDARFPADAPFEVVVRAMAHPINGISRRENTQMNLTISNSFNGQDLISWLADHVTGLDDRKRCEGYANELVRRKFIVPAIKKDSFTAFCYYTINESKIAGNTMRRGVCTPLDLNIPTIDDTLPEHICKKKYKIPNRALKGRSEKLEGCVLDAPNKNGPIMHHVYCPEKGLVFQLTNEVFFETVQEIDKKRRNDIHRMIDEYLKFGDYIYFKFDSNHRIVDYERGTNVEDGFIVNGRSVFKSKCVFNPRLDSLGEIPTPNVEIYCYIAFEIAPNFTLRPELYEIKEVNGEDQSFVMKPSWAKHQSTHTYDPYASDNDVQLEDDLVANVGALTGKMAFITGLTSVYLVDQPAVMAILPKYNLKNQEIGREAKVDLIYNDVLNCYVVFAMEIRRSHYYLTRYLQLPDGDIRAHFYLDLYAGEVRYGFYKVGHLGYAADPHGYLDIAYMFNTDQMPYLSASGRHFVVPVIDRLGKRHETRQMSALNLVTRFEIAGSGDSAKQLRVLNDYVRKHEMLENIKVVVIDDKKGLLYSSRFHNCKIWLSNNRHPNGQILKVTAKRSQDPNFDIPTFEVVESQRINESPLFYNNTFRFPASYEPEINCYVSPNFGFVPSADKEQPPKSKLGNDRWPYIIAAIRNPEFGAQTALYQGRFQEHNKCYLP